MGPGLGEAADSSGAPYNFNCDDNPISFLLMWVNAPFSIVSYNRFLCVEAILGHSFSEWGFEVLK